MDVAAGIYTRIVFPHGSSMAEPYLSDMQRAMLDATPDCIKVLSLDGRLLAMNRAGCLALGVPQDAEFGMPWLPLLPEEVHAGGLEALRKAAAGEAARFPGKSLSTNGVIYWDNLLTPVMDSPGRVLSILCVSRDVTAKTLLEMKLEEAIDRERLLSREMHHRIKNLFSVVSGLLLLSEKEARSSASPEALGRLFRDKLDALSRASDAAMAEPDADATMVDLALVLRSVLRPYGERCILVGTVGSIGRGAMTAFALFLHELATNSVKYGALSTDAGTITVSWTTSAAGLDLTWVEAGGPPLSTAPRRRGFGTEMVDRIVQAAGGALRRTWRAEGLVVELRLPAVTAD